MSVEKGEVPSRDQIRERVYGRVKACCWRMNETEAHRLAERVANRTIQLTEEMEGCAHSKALGLRLKAEVRATIANFGRAFMGNLLGIPIDPLSPKISSEEVEAAEADIKQ